MGKYEDIQALLIWEGFFIFMCIPDLHLVYNENIHILLRVKKWENIN
jgi:hypothetical protein